MGAQRFSETELEELRQWALGRGRGHTRRTCPACSKERQNRKAECLSVEITQDKVLVRCWHCDRAGAAWLEKKPVERRFASDGPRRREAPYRAPAPLPARQTGRKPNAVKEVGSSLDAGARIWLKTRGISEETAEFFGLVWARAYFPDLQRETNAIAFPYHLPSSGSEWGVSGHKVRSLEDKAHVCDKALYSPFGLQNVDIGDNPMLLWVEGEVDCLSIHEAGIPNCLSVPNGASSFSRTDEEDIKSNYGFLWPAKEQIDAAKKIVIAVDQDEAGEKLAEELARRIGRHKCWRATWPQGCKDANDTLLKHGKEKIRECIGEAEPWPIAGLYEAEKFFPAVLDLYENGFGERVKTGMTGVDDLYSVAPGLLTIVTGLPANGKSQIVDYMMLLLARRYGSTFCILSFENPPHVHIAKLAEMLLQKHFFDSEMPGQRMTMEELQGVLPFIHKHFKFMHQEDGNKADIESIIERIKTAVFRWGVDGAVVDPFNYISRPKSAESETQWIDDILTRLRLQAQLYGIHLWFVAHPTKMQMDAEGNYPPPRGFSISGSASWYAKADFGLTVHKNPEYPSEVRFINWKTRYHWLGKEGETTIVYDNTAHIYYTDSISDMIPMEIQ